MGKEESSSSTTTNPGCHSLGVGVGVYTGNWKRKLCVDSVAWTTSVIITSTNGRGKELSG